MRPGVIFALRDARDSLTIYEKVFLLTVESRGKCNASAATNMADMCMGKTKYFQTMRTLKQRGLIEVQTKWNPRTGKSEPTTIRVSEDSVRKLSKRGKGDSVRVANSLVRVANSDSPRGELGSSRGGSQKKNLKKKQLQNTSRKNLKTENDDASQLLDLETVREKFQKLRDEMDAAD